MEFGKICDRRRCMTIRPQHFNAHCKTINSWYYSPDWLYYDQPLHYIKHSIPIAKIERRSNFQEIFQEYFRPHCFRSTELSSECSKMATATEQNLILNRICLLWQQIIISKLVYLDNYQVSCQWTCSFVLVKQLWVNEYQVNCGLCSHICSAITHQWPLLLTWFNFNPNMDK